jgi:hypothetical protein
MLRADQASVSWNPDKKRWEVRIQVGGEVMKRHLEGIAAQADETVLKARAVEIVTDEGYAVDPANVSVEQTSGHAA